MEKTTCDWTVERLPWWANGTLDEDEAESVRAHLADCADCRAELAETHAALAVYGAHPSIEALVGFVEGNAADKESRETVEAHLAQCAACAEEVALLRESRAAIEDEPGAAGGTVRAFVPPARGGALRGRHGVDRRSLALAASLLLFVVASGGWLTSGQLAERRADRVAELERRVAAAEAAAERPVEVGAPEPASGEQTVDPDALAAELAQRDQRIAALEEENERLSDRGPGFLGGGPTISWDADNIVLRGAGEESAPSEVVRELPAGAPMANVYIDQIAPGTYRVTVETAQGRRLFTWEELQPQESPGIPRHISLALPLAALPDGPLRLRLYTNGEEIRSLLLRPAK